MGKLAMPLRVNIKPDFTQYDYKKLCSASFSDKGSF